MSVNYRAEMINPGTNETIDNIDALISSDWNRKVNDVGDLKLVIPDYYDLFHFPRNTRIALRREFDDYIGLVGQTVWILRKVTKTESDNTMTLVAKDANVLLSDRLVAYDSTTYYADKTIEEAGWEGIPGGLPPLSDDMCKMYMRENYGTLAVNTDRDLVTPGYLRIGADRGLGAIVEKTAAWQYMLPVLQDIANQSKALDIPIYFDMIPDTTDGSFLFQVFINYRGADRSSLSGKPLVFSQKNENLKGAEIEVDYTDEFNYLYYRGIGSGTQQWKEEYGDASSIRLDPYGRREFQFEDQMVDNENSQMDKRAQGILAANQARVILRGDLVETLDVRYGRDWEIGDLVAAESGGYSFDCTIDAVSGSMKDGEEKISAKIVGIDQV